ncbi:ankyrin repeat domain-containing protein [Parachitinimonas caeni]|uniref:Ankyrin repeat domain-containing protein n=1 Tax=Parachitinimonas caeni TaxID=3031301 RepID=A0ABT7DWJ1_9NEIS|nr:ankyrin repeat domain-containing protein [Parachitinimonas caeni]MDK2124194.1 ankyrin repeat domain-containing protein [Parachitinimonas caeni]
MKSAHFCQALLPLVLLPVCTSASASNDGRRPLQIERPLSEAPSAQGPFNFRYPYGALQFDMEGRWFLRSDSLQIQVARLQVRYGGAQRCSDRCDPIVGIRLALVSLKPSSTETRQPEVLSSALSLEQPLLFGRDRELRNFSLMVPIDSTAKSGTALALSHLPFARPELRFSTSSLPWTAGHYPGLPWAAATGLPVSQQPCAQVENLHQAIAWRCPVQLKRSLAEPATREAINEAATLPGEGGSPQTPLLRAVHSADSELVQALLQAGANPDVPAGNEQLPPLLEAAWDNKVAIARQLLQAGAKVDQIDSSPGREGRTALHYASIDGLGELARLLLKHGANPLHQDSKGWSPYSTALYYPFRLEVLKAMLAAGVSPDQRIVMPAQFGNAAVPGLLLPMATENHAAIKALLAAGANPGQAGPYNYPVGNFAAYWGRCKVLATLREGGVDLLRPTPAQSAHPGETYLMHAAEGGSRECIKYLLQLGAKTDERDAAGRTAADHAKQYGHDWLAFLLKWWY